MLKPKSVRYDQIHDRWLVVMHDGTYLSWSDDGWLAIAWALGGRVDTDWDTVPHPYVWFRSSADAELARWAIQRHHTCLLSIVRKSQEMLDVRV